MPEAKVMPIPNWLTDNFVDGCWEAPCGRTWEDWDDCMDHIDNCDLCFPIAAAVLATLTDTGDNKEQTNA